MKWQNIMLATTVGMLGFQLATAAPEDDWPDFYADVPWDIPAGEEAYTVPTKHAPTMMNTTYNPWCKQADCKTGWKNQREIIRDFTNETVHGAHDQRDAAEHIFYRVRDLVKLEDIEFLSGYSAWKYRAGNSVSKAALVCRHGAFSQDSSSLCRAQRGDRRAEIHRL